MASSPRRDTADLGDQAAASSDAAFALQELNACWSQAYDAIGRGELDTIDTLLNEADTHLSAAGDGTADTPTEQQLRRKAAMSFARLQHAMKSGLEGIRDELGKQRRGKRALRGYDRSESDAGSRVTRQA